MARLLIDGYNLGLRKGTGVATYGRNLCREASAVGHEVWALYGQRFGDSGNPLLREIAFFDQVEKQPHAVPRALRTIQQAVSGPLGHSPQEVRLSGSVISRPFEARLPQCSRVYNGMSLYSASAASFALWGQLAKVRMPERPDLAHWT